MDMFQCIPARSNELSLHGYCSNYSSSSNTTNNNSINHEEDLMMMSIWAMCNYDTSASLGFYLPEEEVEEDDPLITATRSDANPLSSTCKEAQAEENEVEEERRGEKEEEEVEERKEKEEYKREEGRREKEDYREGTRRKRKIVKISEKEEVDEEYKREKEVEEEQDRREKEEEEGKVKDEYEEGNRGKRKRVKISKDPQCVVARNRRHRISQKMRILRKLVPGGMKLDTASMLDEAVQHLKRLKAQVRSMEAFMNASENADHITFPFSMPIMPMPMEYYYQSSI